MKKLSVLGIMSGTSIDGVDYALCRIDERAVRLEHYWHVSFPARLRQRLHEAARGVSAGHELAQLHHDLGRFYATGALRSKRKAQLVGLHGQTVFHRPSAKVPATFQAGEPAYLAEALRIPVVNNFRAGDVAAGGEGAPLATIFHRLVFGLRGQHVCVNNLGGISNVTSLDWRRAKLAVVAFDTGPANVLLDQTVRHFTNGREIMDRDGARAAQGRIDAQILRAWLRHPFLRKAPPKSTGRELFGERFSGPAWARMREAGLSVNDALATLTEFTAASIALNYRLHLPARAQRVVLAGGGAANRTLRERITENLRALWPTVEVVTSEQFGWPLETIEPAAFAYLAYLRYMGIPSNIPETTGARRAVSLGQVTEL